MSFSKTKKNGFSFNNRELAVKIMTRVSFQIYRSDAGMVVLVGLLLFFFWYCFRRKIETTKGKNL